MLLSELLSIRPGVTALIGGGGKTTAMYTLARELRARGTVICTTTTRIYPPDHMPVMEEEAALPEALARWGCVCAGTRTEEGKLASSALSVERLAALADYVLVEADGSRGLPVKAHLSHEPVIPPEAERTILLAGASGFGRPVGEAVHRPERFCALAGVTPETPVTAGNLAAVLKEENLGSAVFVNQAESPEAMEEARRLAALVPWPVFAGSLQGGTWLCLS